MINKDKKSLVIITNLYPLPWQPTRATFNFQQFELLNAQFKTYILIPVAFADWFKHRNQAKNCPANVKIVPYAYIPKFGRRFYSSLMYYSIKLLAWRWLKKINPEKILASWAFPDGVAGEKIAKKLNSEFYLKVHGSDINMHALYPARAKQITTMANKSKGILSVSQDLADKMVNLGVNSSKINVIYNGVNLEKFTPTLQKKTDDASYLLFVGNLKKEKGVTELLQAFIRIHQEHPQLILKYIGEGVMLEQLKQQVITEQLSENVIFEGVLAHHQLPEVIANAQLLILPSYNEGVPNVILEAMACGVPVVASRVGGIAEVLPEYCGILAEEITAESIAQALTKALNRAWNTSLIRSHAEQFNWQKNIAQLTDMLNNSVK